MRFPTFESESLGEHSSGSSISITAEGVAFEEKS